MRQLLQLLWCWLSTLLLALIVKLAFALVAAGFESSPTPAPASVFVRADYGDQSTDAYVVGAT